MKTKLQSLILLLSLVAIASLTTGCKVEGCTNINSDNYNPEATVDDGSCILAREKFIAQYNVAESCPSGNFTFAMNIVASTTAEDAVILNNLGDFGSAINGTVSGSSITIPNQNITIQGIAVSINGSGSINGNLLIINYSYNFAGGGETCSMNCTKQ